MGIVQHTQKPFADWVSVSFPNERWSELDPGISEVVSVARGYESLPGLWRLGQDGGDPGTVKYTNHGAVGSVGVSGRALASLRAAGVFEELLMVFGSGEHRVTTLHATLDVPTPAPAVLRRICRRAEAGSLALGRKALTRSQVSYVRRRGWIDGGHTGTVYLGNRNSGRVWAKVYDKRNEILDRSCTRWVPSPELLALVDPGPLTRYEVSLGRHVGCTLHDCADPELVFWHVAGDVLLPRPPGVAPWVPRADGYVLAPREERLPAVQLELLLERSPDVRRALELSRRIGREGFNYLVRRLQKLCGSEAEGRPCAATPPSTALAGVPVTPF